MARNLTPTADLVADGTGSFIVVDRATRATIARIARDADTGTCTAFYPVPGNPDAEHQMFGAPSKLAAAYPLADALRVVIAIGDIVIPYRGA